MSNQMVFDDGGVEPYTLKPENMSPTTSTSFGLADATFTSILQAPQ
jgi:hypothetical protein